MLRRFLIPILLTTSMLGAELKQQTIDAWDVFVHQRTTHVSSPNGLSIQLKQPASSKLVIPDDRRSRLKAGEIITDPAVAKGMIVVPDGLIHDWIGIAFFRDASIDDVLKVTGQYSRYKQVYSPYIVEGTLVRADSSSSQFILTFRQHALSVDATVYGEFESRYSQLDPTNAYESTTSTRLQETINVGKPAESRLPEDTGRGYIWRLNTIRTYHQADGGVYVQLEVIALSRSIPSSLRWLVNPVVARISKSAVITTLSQTRDAVKSPSGALDASLLGKSSRQDVNPPVSRSGLLGSSLISH